MEKVNPGLSQSLGLDFGENIEKEILTLSSKLDIEKLALYIDNYIKTNESLKNAQIKQLPLELVTIKLSENRKTHSSNSLDKKDNGNYYVQEKRNSENSVNKKETNNYSFKENSVNKVETDKENEAKVLKESEKKDRQEDSQVEKININIEDIQAKWREFILKIKSENHSLTFILQNCWPSDVKDGIIDLKCKYKFHQQRLKDANIQDIINKNLKTIFKCNLKYATNIDSNLEIPSSRLKKEKDLEEKNVDNIQTKETKKEKSQVDDKQKGDINNILNAFGGEVIS